MVKMKAVKEKKEKSLELFKELPIPSPKLETWKYTDIRKLELDKFKEISQVIEFPDLTDEIKEKGVIFTNIKTAIDEHFELIPKARNKRLIELLVSN